MSLLQQWNISNLGKAAIWKIEETEDFFVAATGLTSDIANSKRRIEHLAGRFLLRHLVEDFPLDLIARDEFDKPRLPDNELFFSISHSWPYVAVVVDPIAEAGIDIQTWRPKIESIKHKYLSTEEQEMLAQKPQNLLLAWCAKEAAYKWHGRRGVEFIEQLPIVNLLPGNHMNIYLKLTAIPQMLTLTSILHEDFACSFVSDAQDWAMW